MIIKYSYWKESLAPHIAFLVAPHLKRVLSATVNSALCYEAIPHAGDGSINWEMKRKIK